MGNSTVTFLYLRLQKGYRWVTDELQMVAMEREWLMDDYGLVNLYGKLKD